MEILYLDYFHDGSNDKKTAYHILSEHCHSTDNKIKLYCEDNFRAFEYEIKGLTFPNIVYIDTLFVYSNMDLAYGFPDLKNIGELLFTGIRNVDDLGKIVSISFFINMSDLLDPEEGFKSKLKCKPLGDKMFRFTSRKGTWDIKVNGYN